MTRPRYQTISINPSFLILLKYIVAYRQLRGKASMRIVTEQLLLAYAKQLATGMPEEVWRNNILALINNCEAEHKELYDKEQRKYQEFKEKEARVAAHYRADNPVL